MCTAATYKTKDFYFGRTLDYEFSYGDEITVTPRNYEFKLRHMGTLSSHYAIIGMAHVAGDYPLYYDGINEKGLGMAGLNFVGNAVYNEVEEGRENIAQFEFIPWILGKCATVKEARCSHVHSFTGSLQIKLRRSQWNPWQTDFISGIIRQEFSPIIRRLTSRCSCSTII